MARALGRNHHHRPSQSRATTSNSQSTDADVDEVVSKRLAKWEKQQAAKVEEAAKLAEMNAQQKAEYERDKVRSLTYKRRDTVNAMVARVSSSTL